MHSENIKPLNRRYKNKRGRVVHVTGWDPRKQWVIFRLDDYEHPCFEPLDKFKDECTEIK